MGNRSSQVGENINNNSIALTTTDHKSELKGIKDLVLLICIFKVIELACLTNFRRFKFIFYSESRNIYSRFVKIFVFPRLDRKRYNEASLP